MVLFVLNFLFILASIILVTLPFMAWFSWHSKIMPTRATINVYFEKFFVSNQSNWLIFTWAASEAVIWYVIPEFLLLLVVFMRIRRKRQMLTYDIAGTLFGTVIALLLRLPQSAIEHMPYIQPRMVEQTSLWYQQHGILALANQPFSGVPYKVFTHLAWSLPFSLLLFLVVAVIVRVVRYLIAYGLFLSLYPRLHRIVRKNYVALALGAILLFSVLLLKTYNLYR